MNPVSAYHVEYPDLPARQDVLKTHFESAYKQYYRKIYCVCLRFGSKPDDAKDLAHDVFIRYFQNFDKLNHSSSPLTWMYRVAVNLVIQEWRRRRTRYLEDHEWDAIPSDARDNESALLDRIALHKILDRFPERMQKVFLMHHVERMTQTEIGKSLGISRSTVIRHVVHVKRSCRRQLSGKPC